MRVGIPKGLLYCNYHPFLECFFRELGAEIITSPNTNKDILDEGVKYCVDEACLPVKVFHGHVAAIKDKCDVLVIPRIMQLSEREYICPKFCGLPEMVMNSMEGLPPVTLAPIYATSEARLFTWAKEAGSLITSDKSRIVKAFRKAMASQKDFKSGIKDSNFKLNVALAGHPYNIYDEYINMNLVKKLNRLGVGVLTEEHIESHIKDKEVKELYKKPFWTFAKNNYGFTVHASKNDNLQGIIYVSSFACGIDSVIVELIKDKIGKFPFMILKIDEHTGEAGLDTRVEAFVDMLERSC